MNLSDEERYAVVIYRIQKANSALKEAEGNLQMDFWTVVANRLYYACYYAVSALLIKNGFTAQTHAGVIRLFGLHFITTGLVDKKYSKLYGKLFELRQTGDYDDIYLLEKKDVDFLIEPVKEFLVEIERLLDL